MQNGTFRVPLPQNEPVLGYAPGSPERNAIREHLRCMAGETIEIPARIGGQRVHTGKTAQAVMPHDHRHVLATWHQCGAREVEAAVAAAAEAWQSWSRMPFHERAAIFLKAADLLAGPYRHVLNGATMLGQSKTVHQAEIDSACELIDFWRFNVKFAQDIYEIQPRSSPGCGTTWSTGPWRLRLRGDAVQLHEHRRQPSHGTAILGNVSIWKPASSSIYSAHYIMEILEAAGLPPGVVNMVPGSGSKVGDPVMASGDLAGLHFTGSTEVFRGMWKTMAENLPRYRGYPRIVG
jgi:1-pyrroline-5-carboxylate dehydrogenase